MSVNIKNRSLTLQIPETKPIILTKYCHAAINLAMGQEIYFKSVLTMRLSVRVCYREHAWHTVTYNGQWKQCK